MQVCWAVGAHDPAVLLCNWVVGLVRGDSSSAAASRLRKRWRESAWTAGLFAAVVRFPVVRVLRWVGRCWWREPILRGLPLLLMRVRWLLVSCWLLLRAECTCVVKMGWRKASHEEGTAALIGRQTSPRIECAHRCFKPRNDRNKSRMTSLCVYAAKGGGGGQSTKAARPMR